MVGLFACNNICLKKCLVPTSWRQFHKNPFACSKQITVTQNLKDTRDFNAAWPGMLNFLVKESRLSQESETASWVKKIFDNTVNCDKKFRGLATVNTYKTMEEPQNITKETIQRACVLGWCVEMTYIQETDDIIHRLTTRRGKSCWYPVDGVGHGAMDTYLMYCSVIEILDKYIGKQPYYVNVLSLVNEAIYYTMIGEHMDHKTCSERKYDQYTLDLYNKINTYKGAHYSIRLPVLLGMKMVKNVDKSTYKDIEEITLEIGRFFQMQDDYIDIYGDERCTGKAGTDIQEGKCTWVAATALQRCSEAQRKEFIENYGSDDAANIQRIKQLYNDLHIPELYEKTEKQMYKEIVRRANTLPLKSATSTLLYIVDENYKTIN